MSTNKPREYGVSGETAMLLKPDWDINQCRNYVAQFGRYGDPEPIRVIEYSAYQSLLVEAKKLRDKLASGSIFAIDGTLHQSTKDLIKQFDTFLQEIEK